MVTPVATQNAWQLKGNIMVDHDLLHRELANLATGLDGDADVHEGLHQLSTTAAAALGLDGAGVTLRMPSGDTQYITASDPVTAHVETRQDELQEGACVDAMNASEIVAVGDLSTELRWPEFGPVLREAGFHAVAGVPIPFQGRNIGALNLYGNDSRMWTTEEFTAARLVADLAAGYVINSHLLQTAQTLAAQLQHALDSRIIIEQAKGMLAGRHGMTPDAAFEVLRSYARSARVKLHDVARDVVSGNADVFGDEGASRQNAGSA